MKKVRIVSIDAQGRVKETKRLLWTVEDALSASSLCFLGLSTVAFVSSACFHIAEYIAPSGWAKACGRWLFVAGSCSFLLALLLWLACVIAISKKGVEDD